MNMDESPNLYSDYHIWKGWKSLFCYSLDKADYFTGEMRGLAISNADVLEIGFGSGAFLQWAKDSGARVWGTEINADLLTAAKERGISVIEGDIEAAELRYASSFDTIVAFDVFEHFTKSEIHRRLLACERMLKPGGCLLMSFPNAQSPFGLRPQHGDPTHCTALSLGIIEKMVGGTDFEKVRYRPPYYAKGRTLRTLVGRFVRHILKTLIGAAINFVYASRIPYDPVVVLVLRRGYAGKTRN